MKNEYKLHFRSTDVPLIFTDILLQPKCYGDFDYHILQKGDKIAGFLSQKGLQQTYKLGENLLNDNKLAKEVLSNLRVMAKNEDDGSLEGIEKLEGEELIKRWRIILKSEKDVPEYYKYCEQPMEAALEEEIMKSCRNMDEMMQVLKEPNSADKLGFSKKSKKALELLIELGELKLAIHNGLGPWMEVFYVLAKIIAKKNYLSINQALAIRVSEMKNALLSKAPSVNILNSRIKGCVFLPSKKGEEFQCLTGKHYEEWQKKLEPTSLDKIEGNPAYPGQVRGIVKIHLSFMNTTSVPKGTVLVSGMTNPQIVPMLKNAVAIVTDEGGITSHAAIISRELKIPCVVGTGNSTIILKDGDEVEVDANKGIVRIIK